MRAHTVRKIRFVFLVLMFVALAGELALQAQSGLRYGVEYKCGERLKVYYCRSDDQSRDAYPVQPQDDYCSVEYPDRPSNPGFVYTGSELRSELIKKLQACGVLSAAQPKSAQQPSAPASTSTSAAKSAHDYFLQGLKLYQEKKYADAIEVLKKAVALDPSMGYATFNLALCYNDLKKYTEAIPLYKQLLAAKWEDVPGGLTRIAVMQLLAISYIQTGRYADAEAIYRQAVAREPKNPHCQFGLGKSLALQGKKPDALQVHRALLALDKPLADNLYQIIEKGSSGAPQVTQTQSANGYLAEGQKYRQAKDDAKALQAYQSALAVGGNPGTLAQVHFEMGQLYSQQRQDEKAVASFREALRLNPNLIDARANLGVSYYLLGKYPEALKELHETVRVRPTDYISYDWLAATYVAQGKKEEAVAAWKQALAAKPQDARFLVQTGNELEKKKEYDAALGAFLSAVQLKPETTLLARAQYGLGLTYNESDKQEQAIAPLLEAIRLKPNYPEAHYELGRAYLAIRRYPLAIAEFKTAIRLNPNDGWSVLRLGEAYDGLNQRPQAIAIWKQLMARKQTEKLVLLSLAEQFEYGVKEYDLALAAYRMVPDALPGQDADEQFNAVLRDSDAYSGMARMYFELKQYQEIVRLAESVPEEAYIFSHELGTAYVALNQLAQAAKVFEDAVKLDEEKRADSLYDLGHCYNLMGRKPDARRIYAKLRAIEQELAAKLLAEINPN